MFLSTRQFGVCFRAEATIAGAAALSPPALACGWLGQTRGEEENGDGDGDVSQLPCRPWEAVMMA